MGRAQQIIIWSGVFLIVAGVALIVVQMLGMGAVTAPERSMSRSAAFEMPGGMRANVQTTYVGFLLVVTGALLEVVGFLGARAWVASLKASDNETGGST